MASEFSFEKGDTVLVRVREHGTSGDIIAKFEGECVSFSDGAVVGSKQARFKLPFGVMNSVTLQSTEAEFEVINDA